MTFAKGIFLKVECRSCVHQVRLLLWRCFFFFPVGGFFSSYFLCHIWKKRKMIFYTESANTLPRNCVYLSSLNDFRDCTIRQTRYHFFLLLSKILEFDFYQCIFFLLFLILDFHGWSHYHSISYSQCNFFRFCTLSDLIYLSQFSYRYLFLFFWLYICWLCFCHPNPSFCAHILVDILYNNCFIFHDILLFSLCGIFPTFLIYSIVCFGFIYLFLHSFHFIFSNFFILNLHCKKFRLTNSLSHRKAKNRKQIIV